MCSGATLGAGRASAQVRLGLNTETRPRREAYLSSIAGAQHATWAAPSTGCSRCTPVRDGCNKKASSVK